ncbi:hypothetical protein S40293_05075 [Stachybotrys chartarum IBT 40293]|nr:hypothetical protein S40293_05075 [Stachybotrys chartarum IBT 40293]
MAPGTRRANRSGFAEHDDFEGLPVRQWRQEFTNIAPPAPQEQQQAKNDIWSIELFHGMPKDANLLAPHSQELLRAARSGRLYKRPVPTEEEEVDVDGVLGEKLEKKEEEVAEKGFTAKLWKQIPRNVEGSSISHLAKRRKGTVTIASRTVDDNVQTPMITRATVRRVDAAGNAYTEDVVLTEGQPVQGEIISTRTEPAPAARTDAAPQLPTPQRRRPPPPKRKSKAGPGRGKKKVKQTIPLPLPAPVAGAPPAVQPAAAAAPVKVEGEEGNNTVPPATDENSNQDTEMADGGDDDEEDDEEGDEGEDGEEEEQPAETSVLKAGEENDKDQEMTDAAPLEPPVPAEPTIEPTDDALPRPASPLNPLTLNPTLESLPVAPIKIEGSPLKNVMLPSPTDAPQMNLGLPLSATENAAPLTATESTIAEPPSTIVGDDPEEATDRDIPHAPLPGAPTDEALLPPPPDQVGNIASPKAEDGSEKDHRSEEAAKEDTEMKDDVTEKRPVLEQHDSAMTVDSIRPDDSASVTASVTAPLTEEEEPIVESASIEEEDANVSEVASTSLAVVEDPLPVPAAEPAEIVEPAVPAVALVESTVTKEDDIPAPAIEEEISPVDEGQTTDQPATTVEAIEPPVDSPKPQEVPEAQPEQPVIPEPSPAAAAPVEEPPAESLLEEQTAKEETKVEPEEEVKEETKEEIKEEVNAEVKEEPVPSPPAAAQPVAAEPAAAKDTVEE